MLKIQRPVRTAASPHVASRPESQARTAMYKPPLERQVSEVVRL